MCVGVCVCLQPSRPGYPSPRSSEGFYPSPQHMGQHNYFQVIFTPYLSIGFTNHALQATHKPLGHQPGVFICNLHNVSLLFVLLQMGGYPGPHTMPSMPSGLYPPQASGMGLDHHDGWNHHRAAQDHTMWNPNMEVRGRRMLFFIISNYQS